MPKVNIQLTYKWVLLIAILALIVTLFLLQLIVLNHTNGIVMYVLDDAFIHMSIAKNIVQHHVWGISANEFSSASSSIIYPMILAVLFSIFGFKLIIPLLVNLVTCLVFIIHLQKRLIRYGIASNFQLVIFLAIIFLAPLPYIILTGMEHSIQILVCYLFIFGFFDWYRELNDGQTNNRLPISLLVYGIFVTATRFEGIFIIGIAFLFLLLRKQYFTAIYLVILSSLPIIIFGIYSVYKGSYFLPNSVLVKSSGVPTNLYGFLVFVTDDMWTKIYFDKDSWNVMSVQRLLIIFPLVSLFFKDYNIKKDKYQSLSIFLTALIFVHLCFAKIDLFYRYEMYLIVISIITIGIIIGNNSSIFNVSMNNYSILSVRSFLLILLLMPIVARGSQALLDTTEIIMRHYDQNYNMGQFLHKYYNKSNIAIYDIGHATYFTDADDLDIVGLGNNEVARSKLKHYNNVEFYEEQIKKRNIKLAVIYDFGLPKQLLSKWKKVATWRSIHFSLGPYDLQYYAVDTSGYQELKDNLKEFEPNLPKSVVVTYY